MNKQDTFISLYEEFSKETFFSLIERTKEIELSLKNALVKSVVTSLHTIGYKYDEHYDYFFISNKKVQVKYLFDYDLRHFIISVLIKSNNKYSKKSITANIDDFGQIRSLEVLVSNNIYSEVQLGTLLVELKGICFDYYNALRESIEISSYEFSKKIINNLYSILKIGFYRELRNFDFISHCWFIIFQKESGLFLLNHELIIKAINFYITNQQNDISPCELLINLLTKPLPFNKTVSKESFALSTLVSAGFSKSKYKDAAHELWLSIGVLQSFEDFTIIPIDQFAEYNLVLGFKKQYQEVFTKVYNQSKDLIIKAFRKSISENKNFYITIKTNQLAIKNQLISKMVRDLNNKESSNVNEYIPVLPKVILMSYHENDKKWKALIKTYMSPLLTNLKVKILEENTVNSSFSSKEERKKFISDVDIVILLISPSYINQIGKIEQESSVLNIRKDENKTIFWILISQCMFEETPLESIQAANDIKMPLDQLNKSLVNKELLKISKKLKTLLI